MKSHLLGCECGRESTWNTSEHPKSRIFHRRRGQSLNGDNLETITVAMCMCKPEERCEMKWEGPPVGGHLGLFGILEVLGRWKGSRVWGWVTELEAVTVTMTPWRFTFLFMSLSRWYIPTKIRPFCSPSKSLTHFSGLYFLKPFCWKCQKDRKI